MFQVNKSYIYRERDTWICKKINAIWDTRFKEHTWKNNSTPSTPQDQHQTSCFTSVVCVDPHPPKREVTLAFGIRKFISAHQNEKLLFYGLPWPWASLMKKAVTAKKAKRKQLCVSYRQSIFLSWVHTVSAGLKTHRTRLNKPAKMRHPLSWKLWSKPGFH